MFGTGFIPLCISAVLLKMSTAQKSLFQPCPLLGPFVPAPRIDPSSAELQSAFQKFSSVVDEYVAAGDGRFGPITPNTTTFSIALFAGSTYDAPADAKPYFYEYHRTATTLTRDGNRSDDFKVDADSAFALGDLTQVFTVLTVLAEAGDQVWSKSIVDYIPELVTITSNSGGDGALRAVQWKDVTLGALAGHMAADACTIDILCDQNRFLQGLARKPPVYLPDTTPAYSNAAFQLLAIAMERACGRPFADIMADRVLEPLRMNNSRLIEPETRLFGDALSNASRTGEQAALGLTSSIHDLSLIGRAILTNHLITPAQTRRWLKPISDSSNLRDSVGRPWQIYHFGDKSTDAVVDIYTKFGSIGRYSSYFGLAPDSDVGFAILAVDTENDSPDLNAYADVVVGALLEINTLAVAQANATLTGTFTSLSNSSITVAITGEQSGMAITQLAVNGTDWLAAIAHQSGITPDNLDFRLYPTDLEESTRHGQQRAFRAVIQDKSALVDAGTPTCVSWMTVDELYRQGMPLDDFVFVTDESGVAQGIKWPALSVTFSRS